MKEAIEKAIKGGYDYDRKRRPTKRISSKKAKIFLDPLFWQALGKSLEQGDFKTDTQGSWKYNWHRFIDHLASGEDVGSFFTALLTNNKKG